MANKEHTKVYEANRKKWKAEVVGQIQRFKEVKEENRKVSEK